MKEREGTPSEQCGELFKKKKGGALSSERFCISLRTWHFHVCVAVLLLPMLRGSEVHWSVVELARCCTEVQFKSLLAGGHKCQRGVMWFVWGRWPCFHTWWAAENEKKKPHLDVWRLISSGSFWKLHVTLGLGTNLKRRNLGYGVVHVLEWNVSLTAAVWPHYKPEDIYLVRQFMAPCHKTISPCPCGQLGFLISVLASDASRHIL